MMYLSFANRPTPSAPTRRVDKVLDLGAFDAKPPEPEPEAGPPPTTTTSSPSPPHLPPSSPPLMAEAPKPQTPVPPQHKMSSPKLQVNKNLGLYISSHGDDQNIKNVLLFDVWMCCILLAAKRPS